MHIINHRYSPLKRWVIYHYNDPDRKINPARLNGSYVMEDPGHPNLNPKLFASLNEAVFHAIYTIVDHESRDVGMCEFTEPFLTLIVNRKLENYCLGGEYPYVHFYFREVPVCPEDGEILTGLEYRWDYKYQGKDQSCT